MTINEIEQAISHLSHNELTRFRQWFADFDVRVWDEQFESDAQSGRLDKIAEKALTDYQTGKAKEL
jgi:hypothetical protein